MTKIFIELNKSEFDKKKISSNKDNTEYTIGGTGEGYVGVPDILYNQVVFVPDTNMIFTRGNQYATSVTANIVDETSRIYTLQELNDIYSTLSIGQCVICPNAKIRFTKTSTNTWFQEIMTVQRMSELPIKDYDINGEKCIWNTGVIDLSSKQVYVEYTFPSTTGLSNSNILSMGKEIASWSSGKGSNIHCYYTVSPDGMTKSLKVSFVPISSISGGIGNNTSNNSIVLQSATSSAFNGDKLIFTIDNTSGFVVTDVDGNVLFSKSMSNLSVYSDLFDTTSFEIGSQEGDVRGYGVYNLIDIKDI